MPKFKFTAMDARGKETEDVVEAESKAKAVAAVRARGMFPTNVMELGAGGKQKKGASVQASVVKPGEKPKIGRKGPLFGGRPKTKHLMVLTRQLATLIGAGMPLLRGLRILAKQQHNVFLKDAVNGMGEAVEGGSTFSEALSQYPAIFDKLYINMVKAGEAGGVLDTVLTKLAEFMEKADQIRSKIKSAMTYPVVVLVAAVGIVSLLMILVIPQFEAIFKDLMPGKALPLLTRIVIGTSRAFVNHWLVMAIAIGGITVGIRVAAKTKSGRLALDAFKLKAPALGQLNSKTAVGRFARTLGTLLNNGVNLLQALIIARDTAGNEIVANAIARVHDAVKEGDPMAKPMAACGIFPDIVVSMVDVGEETGKTPEMLIKIADNYEEEVDRAVEALTSIIEPIMIIFLAVIIGSIVIAMFMPLLAVIGEIGGSN